ncbi:hypothetical protein [Kutzneria buriramensis]|uniref:Uncharacterized protein n=1 Tax=Kutzneria buriramensis TaxID=1045776 RepID=A0A3E0G7M3_9PSEU|nr:hypothetical protein [Kutzneria buriramensis]REH18058.1 hypothetical protein BCF44_13845 [Kutzneria buriramensis]
MRTSSANAFSDGQATVLLADLVAQIDAGGDIDVNAAREFLANQPPNDPGDRGAVAQWLGRLCVEASDKVTTTWIPRNVASAAATILWQHGIDHKLNVSPVDKGLERLVFSPVDGVTIGGSARRINSSNIEEVALWLGIDTAVDPAATELETAGGPAHIGDIIERAESGSVKVLAA